MPRYRMLKPIPAVIEFRGGSRLESRRNERTYGGEGIYFTRYPLDTTSAVTLVECESGESLDAILADGFTPKEAVRGDKIMEILIRLGYAERLD